MGPAGRTPGKNRFNWREAIRHLRASVLRAPFLQFSDPGRVKSPGRIEAPDRTAATSDRADHKNRVDRKTCPARFDGGAAVQYFCEPFPQAFDPELHKKTGGLARALGHVLGFEIIPTPFMVTHPRGALAVSRSSCPYPHQIRSLHPLALIGHLSTTQAPSPHFSN